MSVNEPKADIGQRLMLRVAKLASALIPASVPGAHNARLLSHGAVMRRRRSLGVLGCAAVARPLAARAQQLATPVIGFFRSGEAHASAPLLAAFRSGLKLVAGFVEGLNAAIEYR